MIFHRINCFRLKLKVKRHAAFIVLGLYVAIFFYVVHLTQPGPRSTYSEQSSDNSDNLEKDKSFNLTYPAKNVPLTQKSQTVIAVLVLVCDRDTVTRTLDQLIKYRPSAKRFPIVLSQDCGKKENGVNALTRSKYRTKLTYLTHPNYEEVEASILNVTIWRQGYYHIAAHFGWALNYTFNKLGYDTVIIVEDDLDISPDFFEYFESTLPLLHQDKSLWCVSAYNDNGKPHLIDSDRPELLYRTDFFPGLGWMLTRDLWSELSVKWPASFWDDWMREPEQRKNRSCIHPEISRSKTFGRTGVSNGQFFFQHLDSIMLNNVFVPFKSYELSYLLKDKYDENFLRLVNKAIPLNSIKDLDEAINNTSSDTDSPKSYRLTYQTEASFKSIASHIGLMDDFKSGVPRGGYKDIVPVLFKGVRVYVVRST